MCICVPHTCSAHGCQKRVFGPRELELQLIVSFCVGDRLDLDPLEGQQSTVLTAELSLLCKEAKNNCITNWVLF